LRQRGQNAQLRGGVKKTGTKGINRENADETIRCATRLHSQIRGGGREDPITIQVTTGVIKLGKATLTNPKPKKEGEGASLGDKGYPTTGCVKTGQCG